MSTSPIDEAEALSPALSVVGNQELNCLVGRSFAEYLLDLPEQFETERDTTPLRDGDLYEIG